MAETTRTGKARADSRTIPSARTTRASHEPAFRSSLVTGAVRPYCYRGCYQGSEKLAEQSRALGEHFDVTIRTGTFCAYVPDPRAPMAWRLLMATVQPPERNEVARLTGGRTWRVPRYRTSGHPRRRWEGGCSVIGAGNNAPAAQSSRRESPTSRPRRHRAALAAVRQRTSRTTTMTARIPMTATRTHRITSMRRSSLWRRSSSGPITTERPVG